MGFAAADREIRWQAIDVHARRDFDWLHWDHGDYEAFDYVRPDGVTAVFASFPRTNEAHS